MIKKLKFWWFYLIELKLVTSWIAFFYGIPLVKRLPGFALLGLTALLAVYCSYWAALCSLIAFFVYMRNVTVTD